MLDATRQEATGSCGLTLRCQELIELCNCLVQQIKRWMGHDDENRTSALVLLILTSLLLRGMMMNVYERAGEH